MASLINQVKIGFDMAELRKLGLSHEMFVLLYEVVRDKDVMVRPEWLHNARRVVETILGHRLPTDGTEVDRRSSDP